MSGDTKISPSSFSLSMIWNFSLESVSDSTLWIPSSPDSTFSTSSFKALAMISGGVMMATKIANRCCKAANSASLKAVQEAVHAMWTNGAEADFLISKLNACFCPCFPAVLNCYGKLWKKCEISTRLLTVLTMCVILHAEQRKREKEIFQFQQRC